MAWLKPSKEIAEFPLKNEDRMFKPICGND